MTFARRDVGAWAAALYNPAVASSRPPRVEFVEPDRAGAPRVGILFIGTGRYAAFFDGFLAAFSRHWFPDVERVFFVYSDVQPTTSDERVVWIPTPHEPWPLPTLHRYDYFLRSATALTRCTHLLFANANLKPLVDIAFEEVFDAPRMLFGVLHPGFAFAKRRLLRPYPGTFETNAHSTAWIGPGRRRYFAGGLNGGTTAEWLRMCGYLSVNIHLDKLRRVNGTGWAIWHDESHVNFYFNRCHPPKVLGPDYLYPEGWSLPVTPKVLVLDKHKLGGHAYMRAQGA